MIPSKFQYHKSHSLHEAIALLNNGGYNKLIAGGHSLLPAMKLRLDSPDALIDIRSLSELRGITLGEGEISIGAATTHGEIAGSAEIQKHFPALASGAGQIGDPQVRNFGTIGGNIAHADPASDWPALLLIADADIEVHGVNGSRLIHTGDFFTGLFQTALEEGEVIKAIHLPIKKGPVCMTYQKFSQPASRYALVGCAALVRKKNGIVKDIRVAYNGVSSHAFRDENVENAILGNALQSATINAASDLAAQDVDALSDLFASKEYRKHLAKVFTKRALKSVCL